MVDSSSDPDGAWAADAPIREPQRLGTKILAAVEIGKIVAPAFWFFAVKRSKNTRLSLNNGIIFSNPVEINGFRF